MRAERRRKKKLIVAFHFQFSNQAAWKCEPCRRQGLEARRRCGWLGATNDRPVIVWARGAVTATTCPKSLTTAEMLRWIEEFFTWRASGRGDLRRYPARTAEAILALEQEMQRVESEEFIGRR